MNSDAFKDIEKLETDLWEAADNLRANSKLTSSGALKALVAGAPFSPSCRMISDRSSPSRVRFAASRPGPLRSDPKGWRFTRERGGRVSGRVDA